MKYVITGKPGVGKSTLFNAIIEVLKKNGFNVGGIIAPEVRENGVRVGFKVINLLTSEETWLARKDFSSHVKVGSYGVLVHEANELVKKAILNALGEADVIAIDEVGPMELKLPSFKPLLLKALDSGKPVIAVIHYRLSDREILLKLETSERIVVSVENREYMRKTIPEKILKELKSTSRS
ncbi:MAG: NTPase [Desulfurococcaceae archaeon]